MDFASWKTSSSSKLGKGFIQSKGIWNGKARAKSLMLLNTIHFGLRGCKEHREMCWGRCKTLPNFHRAGVPRIQWKRNQNLFKERSSECKSHCTENVCCAEQREMSIKGLQILRRKATRGNENRRCAALLGSKQCKIWLWETLVQKSSSRCQ